MRFVPRAALAALIVLAACPIALGWSYKEHIQFTRLAAERIIADPSAPAGLKSFLEKAVPNRLDPAGEEDYFLHTHIGINPSGFDRSILQWAYMPDVHAMKDASDMKVQPFAAHERLMHFIDLEYFLTGDAPRAYKGDLSAKPKLENIPNDAADPRFIQAGYLPLRVEQVYGELVKANREDRLLPVGADDQNNAVYWAGYLAHYAADNTQPQHATADYKSQSYFKNSRKAPNVHAAVEYMMCDDEKSDYPELRKEYWPLFVKQLETFEDPIKADDPFRATLEVAMVSYDALPLIGQAAVKAVQPAAAGERTDKLDIEAFFKARGTVGGVEQSVMEMKARQTAWAVKRIERLWRQAWAESGR